MATTFVPSLKRIIICFLVFNVTTCFGQEYGVIPAEVRSKMDSNKLNGLPTYNGIVTSYLVQCEGLENVELTELQNRAQNITVIQALNIQSTDIIEVVCSGGTGFEQVKSIFSSLVTSITAVTIENRIDQ